MSALDALTPLADELGVSAKSLVAIGFRQNGDAWKSPERDAVGRTIGWSRRLPDGQKRMEKGSKRGLAMPWPMPANAGTSRDDPVLIVEGASDTAAGLDLGFVTVGRPSATGGGEHLKALLTDRHVVVVAENDSAGVEGADSICDALRSACASVRGINPPAGVKDLRAWLKTRGVERAREDLLTELRDYAHEFEVRRPVIDGTPIITRLGDVQPEPVRWLWPGRIALGKLTIVSGDPGLGKSFLTMDFAARVSRGSPWPDAPAVPQVAGGVVILSAEDDVYDTIVPRLIAVGADRNKIVALSGVQRADDNGKAAGERSFSLDDDLPALDRAIRSVENCRLVVIDPVSAFMGGRVDSHKNSDVRSVLAPLAKLAADHGVAMVLVTHMSKGGGGPAIYRAMGSLAFNAAARASWAVTKDTDDPEGTRRLMLSVKNNVGPPMDGLAFRVETGSAGAPTVAWEEGAVTVTADDALARSFAGGGDDDGGALGEAVEWLRSLLDAGPMTAGDVKAAAKRDGIAPRTLDRAKAKVGIRTARTGFGQGACWTWSLSGSGCAHSAPPPDTNPLALYGSVGALRDSEPITSFLKGQNGYPHLLQPKSANAAGVTTSPDRTLRLDSHRDGLDEGDAS